MRDILAIMEKKMRIIPVLFLIGLAAVLFFTSSSVYERTALFDGSVSGDASSILFANIGSVGTGGGSTAGSGLTHMGIPFGGMIMGEILCTCHPPHKLIIVQEYTTNSEKRILVAPPFSRLYQHWTMNPGQYVLGTYTPGPRCFIRVSLYCFPLPTDGMINTGPGAGSSGFYDFSSLMSAF